MKEMYAIVNSMFDSGSSLIEALDISLEDMLMYVLEEHPDKFFTFYKDIYEEYTGHVYEDRYDSIKVDDTLYEYEGE